MTKPVLYPTDDHGNALDRSMGLPVPIDSIILGSANYVDLIDLSAYQDRIFNGFSIYNPDASNSIYIAAGPDFCGAANRIFSVPKNISMSFDDLTYGYGIIDQVSGVKAKKLRALLSATSGTLATGTITHGANNPNNGQGVTINGMVYGFFTNTSNPGIAGVIPVVIGASAAATYGNLATVINNRTSGQALNGVLYGDQALQASDSGTVLTLTSNYSGTQGNGIGISDGGTGVTGTGQTFSGATLASGAGGTTPVIHLW